MEYRALGRTGLKAERILGQALRELGYPREELVVSTKLFFGTASLGRLGMSHVDVLFCHRSDPDTPVEETVRAMNWVIDQGLAHYWGTSEWPEERIEEAWAVADRLGLIGPACEQPEYNLFHRKRVEEEYAPLYDLRGTGLTTWSPLASGVLTGKYSGGAMPEGTRMQLERYKASGRAEAHSCNTQHLAQKELVEKRHQLDLVDRLKPIAEELGCSLAQLSLAWCAHNPHVSTVITGATSLKQVDENMGALPVIAKLTPDVLTHIESIVGRHAD
ncbi:putative voltage-gated potassium channel subunit beta [Micractinium conductrix]|uniref:Voltage-gated potassium channel subunit beta n=1 Tax=Micractinium conductrix TaxID=554055 RepID=A0A2P6VA84_9CHLO|nr:putative voltage-gated potassium channel subunit beta [Micractinium conductrix]|eukprot:PSC71002.1 putative voltage-gated potassium channel subunit beta [Micractinium conductrix]